MEKKRENYMKLARNYRADGRTSTDATEEASGWIYKNIKKGVLVIQECIEFIDS